MKVFVSWSGELGKRIAETGPRMTHLRITAAGETAAQELAVCEGG
jgi:hypothetical protein